MMGVFIPTQFEYTDRLCYYKDQPEISKFVTILDQFVHHYTGTKMYRVRIEYIAYLSDFPMVEYETLSESDLLAMIGKQKHSA